MRVKVQEQRRAAVVFMTRVCIATVLPLMACPIAHAQWQPDQRLTTDTSESMYTITSAWSVATNHDTVHTVWRDKRDGNMEIYYKRSADGGKHWGPDIRLTEDSSTSSTACIAVLGLRVHVAWNDSRDGNSEIYYKRSLDGGEHWEADVRLTQDTAISGTASLATANSMVHAVWRERHDGPDGEIYYMRSTDEGAHWCSAVRLTNNPAYTLNPTIAVSDSIVHVLWNDSRDGNRKIYYKRSTNAGVSWGSDERLTNDRFTSQLPSVAVSGSNVHAVWTDFRNGNYEIYYKRSADGGMNWGTDTRLTTSMDTSMWSSIAVSGSTVHVVWQDDRESTDDIFYKKSTDGGTHWEADTRISNNGATSSERPTVAVSDSAVHVVWMDRRDGPNGEIYYKRNPTGNIPGALNRILPAAEHGVLLQTYPNPTHISATIRYSLSHTMNVRVTVRDILGFVVATPVDAPQHAGMYEVPFDARSLARGMYLCTLETNGHVVHTLMAAIR